jgi:hypothetical protein
MLAQARAASVVVGQMGVGRQADMNGWTHRHVWMEPSAGSLKSFQVVKILLYKRSSWTIL